MDENVFEGGSVAGLCRPTLLDEELVSFRTRLGNGQLERVAADAKDDGAAVDVGVRNLAVQQFPEANAKRPDVDLFVARLVAYHFRGHPSHRSGKAHAGRSLATPCPARSKVADLQDLVATYQYAGKEEEIPRLLEPRLEKARPKSKAGKIASCLNFFGLNQGNSSLPIYSNLQKF